MKIKNVNEEMDEKEREQLDSELIVLIKIIKFINMK